MELLLYTPNLSFIDLTQWMWMLCRNKEQCPMVMTIRLRKLPIQRMTKSHKPSEAALMHHLT